MTISAITDFDKKRKKISLDDGRLIFLLYKGECAKLRLREGEELKEEELERIYEDILKPRVKKRALYYLKASDKTEKEVRKKLRESLYPEELIDYALDFLRAHDFINDSRYAENFAEEKRGRASKREILQKLRMKGVAREEIERIAESISDEDEYDICRKILEKYTRGRDIKDYKERARAWRYLASKGYSHEAIENALCAMEEETEESRGEDI